MRLLTLDIETRPIRAYVWRLHGEQHISLNQIDETGGVICFAAKWHDKPKVIFHSDHHDGHAEMVNQAHALMDEADAIITYNGKAFDIKHLQREFVLAGLAPPSPHKDIDLLTAARSRFKFDSNKLQHVAEQLGIGSKADTGGFELWKACIEADDPKAWATMRRYCCHDVVLTEQVYDRLLPWIKGHPNVTLSSRHHTLDGDGVLDACPQCGRPGLVKRGVAYTTTGAYQQWQCPYPDGCGKYSRSTHRENHSSRTGVA